MRTGDIELYRIGAIVFKLLRDLGAFFKAGSKDACDDGDACFFEFFDLVFGFINTGSPTAFII